MTPAGREALQRFASHTVVLPPPLPRAQAGYLTDVPDLKATNAPFGLTSFALSLLLVFRTNTSYQRWDEARKMWGSMVNRSRDFTRQALGYVPESQAELRSMLVRWSIAYP
jgi:predicted membrane chloride channel (bestrophin family)